MSMGTVCFFDVVYPTLSYKLITGPICFLIALNLWTHYYLVCTTPPGFVDSEPPQPATVFPKSLLWASPRKPRNDYAYRAVSPTSSPLENGLSLDERRDRDRSLNITRAEVTKCRKCTLMRPEGLPMDSDLPLRPPGIPTILQRPRAIDADLLATPDPRPLLPPKLHPLLRPLLRSRRHASRRSLERYERRNVRRSTGSSSSSS
ncbi:hypothetical protein VKT23_015548 [Stygiomarasmius scandens]|uniref:Uncharacterized protein n=1 Tax=Marasmiellus scandens TaxID=2682957 RepID=A0ABR1IXA5_9AGAR